MKNADTIREEIVGILPKLRQFSFAITGSRSDADDLLQATVERLLVKGLPQDADISKWAFRVCKNIYIDDYRARKVRLDASMNECIDTDQGIDAERIVMGEVAFKDFNRAMMDLPDEQRTVLSLVALKGYTYADVAEALEMPIGTVMSRIARARHSLSVAMEGEGKSRANVSDK